jgi:hypothetical protein
MRMRNQWKWMQGMAVLAVVAYGVPASAQMLYRWTTEDGSVAFTDDAKRVPERYRAAAQKVQTRGLSSYARYSPAKTETGYAEQLNARVEKLRALNRELDQREAYQTAVVRAAQQAPEALVRVGRDLQVRVPSNVAEAGPVVVEDVRVLRDGSIFTVHDTVVRQGSRVLMVVKGDHEAYSTGYQSGYGGIGILDYTDHYVTDERELLGEHPLWDRD